MEEKEEEEEEEEEKFNQHIIYEHSNSLPYSSVAGEWGVCWSERGCGLGSEERTVWCADARGRPLPPTLCKDADRPPNSRSCYTSCPGK
ncbi:hypothetical protein E2C01_026090 [Portunus trituberculatus]|uniref:Uncharacterized protein n=1 Tax=Portunus trituberculatus TaxID=210409 RepID=A0A5B7EF53_PORTR|nr:hypothetical protein [Portunus trituberculatus]